MSATKTMRSPERFRASYGPWAVVTGASSGIGRQMALELAWAGVHVVLVARRREVLEQLAGELSERHGIQTRVIDADLADPEAVARMHAATAGLEVGLLVAAAGYGTSGPFLRADFPDELAMLDVNCGALVASALYYGRRFAERGRGGMILMASLVGFQGTPNAAHYAATKAYVQTLAEGLHVELKASGVDVLACAPGPVRSGFADRAGMTMGAALDVSDVALPTLRALARRTTIAPGTLSKVLTWSLAPLSRPLRTRVMGRVMAGMTPEPAASTR